MTADVELDKKTERGGPRTDPRAADSEGTGTALDKRDGQDTTHDLDPDDDRARDCAGPHGRFVVVPGLVRLPAARRRLPTGTEVLLQLRQNTGYMDDHWAAAAAGHVEQGETAYDAARREALEELGVTDLDLEFVTSMQRTQHADPIDERIDFFFTARSWSGEPRIVEPAKCAELRGAADDRRAARPGRPARARGVTRLRAGTCRRTRGSDSRVADAAQREGFHA